MSADVLLVDQIRAGDSAAWNELIARFEGRLQAFVESRLKRRDAAEDVVQETFIGFLTSLPNYDPARSLESYLFSIAAHKLTDHLRREGRRPAVPLSSGESTSGDWNLPGKDRPASSIMRSGERRHLEATALAAALHEQLDRWRSRGEWWKIQCAELLLVRGWANKDVATKLGISEQQVANQKFDLLARLRTLLERQQLSAEVFPELYQEAD
ncbi:MAG TPA: sigma-70 family RNA polymerase sigma factor [Pirellulales bacterium]